MRSPCLLFIRFFIFSLKSGRSFAYINSSFKKEHPETYERISFESLKIKKDKTSIEQELHLILQRGEKGHPIVKSLESLYKRAHKKLCIKIEDHVKKAPFLALAPLFLLQLPSLMILFFYPLLHSFLEELSK